jgi:DNA-directed RNA polymerase specialized sigma24 family protein
MAAFSRLGDRCQQLLRLLMSEPTPGYDEVAAALDLPVGSIGPTRARCLHHLRELIA